MLIHMKFPTNTSHKVSFEISFEGTHYDISKISYEISMKFSM